MVNVRASKSSTRYLEIRDKDGCVRLDTKAVFDPAYDGRRYGNYIYSRRSEPRLPPEDAAWAASLLPVTTGPFSPI